MSNSIRIPGKDHRHQTAVTTFTENGPFQDYTRKTALFRATQIFQKVTKVVVNSQINIVAKFDDFQKYDRFFVLQVCHLTFASNI
jgi:hypothetical protein